MKKSPKIASQPLRNSAASDFAKSRPPTITLLEKSYTSNSVAHTERIAGVLASTLLGGEIIALEGDLGAGKTQFVRGLIRALGASPRRVSSPTFVLLNIYDDGRLIVNHIDAYRLRGSDDLESIGFFELASPPKVTVIEWASRVSDVLPASRINVHIERTGERSRVIKIAYHQKF